MYTNILIAIENSAADRDGDRARAQLATLTGASLLLVHVADGWAARHYDELALRESEEIKDDRAYLERIVQDLVASGFTRARQPGDGRSGHRAGAASPMRSMSI